MSPFIIETVGYIAAGFGTVLMLPQVIKSYKSKQVEDLSMNMVIIYLVNCVLWSFYGFFTHSMPVFLCNIIALCIGLFQLYIKLKYSRKVEI